MLGSFGKKLNFLLLIIVFFFIDQFTKEMVIFLLKPGEFYSPGITSIYLAPVKNEGIFLGLFSFPSYLPITLSFFLLSVFIFLWFYYFKKTNDFAFILVLAGTGGNLWDRLWRGGVLDFIHLKFWPVFNMADFFILLGLILLFFSLIKAKLTGRIP